MMVVTASDSNAARKQSETVPIVAHRKSRLNRPGMESAEELGDLRGTVGDYVARARGAKPCQPGLGSRSGTSFYFFAT